MKYDDRTHRKPLGASWVVGMLMLTAIAGAAGAAEPPEPTSGAPADTSEFFRTYRNYRTYAIEDTLPPLFMSRRSVEVRADRVTLDEIIQRSVDAERTKFDGVSEVAYTESARIVAHFGDPADSTAKRTIYEVLTRVIRDSESVQRIHLGTVARTNGKRDKDDSSEEVTVETHREGLTDIPFFFEDRSRYRFNIEERTLLEDRVLYDISFKPRSEFDSLPTGHFWIDTTDFQIFYLDMQFLKNVPFPLVLAGVDHVILENQRVDGHWMPSRVAIHARLRHIPLVPVPKVVEVAVDFDDYTITPLAEEGSR